jgi:UDP-N-acetylglucosamine--N-acetylmuramyl-(pentapeptide) pyrophosphoryl-undecaprenol N-acetylglucosamine transferase
MAGLLRDVDLIISRAGAGTISEILALEVPSILIPSPYVANNHQYYNALDLKEKGVSLLIEEKDLTANLLYLKINELLTNKNDEYKQMKEHLKNLNMKQSSTIIYNEIKELLK